MTGQKEEKKEKEEKKFLQVVWRAGGWASKVTQEVLAELKNVKNLSVGSHLGLLPQHRLSFLLSKLEMTQFEIFYQRYEFINIVS